MPYLVLAVTCGLPLFLLETAMGQYTQEGGITCWRKICPLAEGKWHQGYPVFIRYLMDLDSRSACDKFLLCSNQLVSILNIILVVPQWDMWNDANVGHSRSLNHLAPLSQNILNQQHRPKVKIITVCSSLLSWNDVLFLIHILIFTGLIQILYSVICHYLHFGCINLGM